MSKLEKFLAKANEKEPRKTIEETIDGEIWEVRELTFQEDRDCYRIAEMDGRFDVFRYNDARMVKATEHGFPWHNIDLLNAYRAKDKYEMPVKLFNQNKAGYQKLLAAVNKVNGSVQTEQEMVEEAKNSSDPTVKPPTSAELS